MTSPIRFDICAFSDLSRSEQYRQMASLLNILRNWVEDNVGDDVDAKQDGLLVQLRERLGAARTDAFYLSDLFREDGK
jgi:hypothetical protein